MQLFTFLSAICR